MIGFSNGTYQPVSEMFFPVESIAINRGYGAYEFLGVFNKKPFYADRHLLRFTHSLKVLRLATHYLKQIEDIINELIERNQETDYYLKFFVLPVQIQNQEINTGELFVFPVQFPPFSNSEIESGMPLISRNYTRFLPDAKSTAYLAGQYWQYEISQAKALDVLFHTHGTVTETSRGNIFWVKNEKVFTTSNQILKGITRSIIIDIIHLNGVEFEEKEASLTEIYHADEVFVTSTTKEVMPIVLIDDVKIGTGIPGSFTIWMIQEFLSHKRSYCSK